MGLTTFWSNITGPRIREITPKRKSASPDRPRPATSSGDGTPRKFSFEDVATEVTIGIQPPVTRADKKALRKSQAAGLARPKSSQGEVKTPKGHERSKSSQGNLRKGRNQDVGGARPKSSQGEAKMLVDHRRQKWLQSEVKKLQNDDRPKSSQGELKKRSKSRDELTALPAAGTDSKQASFTKPDVSMLKQKSDTELAMDRSGHMASAQTPETKEDKKEQRRTRRFSLSRPKSESELKKRKSIFGWKADEVEQIPVMPTLPSPFAHELPADELIRPGTAVTTDDRPGTAFTLDDRPGTATTAFPPFSPVVRDTPKVPTPRDATKTEPPVVQRKSRRMSIGKALSKSTRKSTASETGLSRRASWFQFSNGNGKVAADAPPLPSMPIPAPDFEPPVVARLQTEHRKSTAMSMFRERRASTASQSKRKTWFQSSNLDDEDLDLSAFPPVPELASFPPVPGLIRDGLNTPESSPPNSDTSGELLDHRNFTLVRGDDFEQLRSYSAASQRSFPPKHSASSFLKTTAGVSEGAKEAYRKSSKTQQGGSGGIDKDSLMLSKEEQKREWSKVRNFMEVTGRPHSNDGIVGVRRDADDGQRKQQQAPFRNAEALSKLEFGVAR